MNGDHPLSLLGFGTIGIVLLLAGIALLWFLRKPSHRHPMDDQPERNIAEIREEGGNTDALAREPRATD